LYCFSPKVKCNGKSSRGKQRYLCLSCKRSFTWRLSKPLEQRRFNWFKLWIIEAYSVRELAIIKRVSQSTVKRVIKYWIKQTPNQSSNDFSEVKHIILDGTFLKRPRGIYAAMDSETHKLIYAAVNVRESAKDLLDFYSKLSEAGLYPESATTDGNTAQMKQLRLIWPEIKLQRCIVHVQRQGLSWCRRNPKRTDAKHLRELLLKLTEVKTKEESQRFIKGFYAWENRFGTGIESSPNRGWVFSDIIRARSMVIKAIPNLFHYIDNSKIARSTNALEGYFSRVKEHYRLHRGLSKRNKINYFKWYFYLKPK
jgi:transposase-like protein